MFRKSKKKSQKINAAGSQVAEVDVENKPMAVIVVTDIGADIDDTLALFTLLGAKEDIKIVAIVTSVNNGRERAIVANGFLKLLGGPEIPILPYNDNNKHIQCHTPNGFEKFEPNLPPVEKTPGKIVEICREYIKQGVLIYGIGALTPVGDAITKEKDDKTDYMLQAVRGVYLQGNVDVELPQKRLVPNKDAFNYTNDMVAAGKVFDHFQHTVPIVTMGKFAAYKVDIKKGYFIDWTKMLQKTWNAVKADMEYSESVLQIEVPNLLEINHQLLKRFLTGSPAIFYRAYGKDTTEPVTEENFPEWFKENSEVLINMEEWRPLFTNNHAEFKNRCDTINNVRKDDTFETWYRRQQENETSTLIKDKNTLSEIFHEQKRTIKKTIYAIKKVTLKNFDKWFADARADFSSAHPYDPLLALRMILDVKKMKEFLRMKEAKNISSEAAGKAIISDARTNALFLDDEKVQNKKDAEHVLLGNYPNDKVASLKKPEELGLLLKWYIDTGLQKTGSNYADTKPMEVAKGEWRSMGLN